MGQTASACKPCSSSDPTADTVRVDAGALAEATPAVPDLPKVDEEAAAQEAEREEAEERRAAEEKERLEAERRAAEEAKRLEEEQEEARKRAEEEEAEQRRLQAEEEERKQRLEQQRAEEEQAALEKQRQQEIAEKKAKEAEAERAAAAAKEQVECQQKVDAYLKGKGFKGVTLPRKAFCGAAVLPLHLAIEEGDADTVKALIRCGADASQKNAQGKTARDVAERCNKAGSHESVLAALACKSGAQGGA